MTLPVISEEAHAAIFWLRAEHMQSAAVESLYNAVVIFARVDLQKAERMAQAGSWIAAQINVPAVPRKARGPLAMCFT